MLNICLTRTKSGHIWSVRNRVYDETHRWQQTRPQYDNEPFHNLIFKRHYLRSNNNTQSRQKKKLTCVDKSKDVAVVQQQVTNWLRCV